MISREDFESFMIRMELDYEEIGENLWIIDPEVSGRSSIVVSFSPPLVVLRSAVVQPAAGNERLGARTRVIRPGGR